MEKYIKHLKNQPPKSILIILLIISLGIMGIILLKVTSNTNSKSETEMRAKAGIPQSCTTALAIYSECNQECYGEADCAANKGYTCFGVTDQNPGLCRLSSYPEQENCVVPTNTPTINPTNTPTNFPTPTPPVCDTKKADVVIVLDRSYSMSLNERYNGVTKKQYEWSRDAAISLINNFPTTNGNIRYGLVVYGAKGDTVPPLDDQRAEILVEPPTTNAQAVIASINSNKTVARDQGTCIECGIKLAQRVLANTPSDREKFIVLLSDGYATKTWNFDGNNSAWYEPADISARVAADNAKAQGIKFFAGRYNAMDQWPVGNPDGFNEGEALMKYFAQPDGYYAFRPQLGDWKEAFKLFGELICANVQSFRITAPPELFQ